MSPLGRAAAIAAVVLAVVTVATWDRGGADDAADAPATTVPLDGRQLFSAKGCAGCHQGPGSTARFVDFPSLARASEWAGTRIPGMSAEEYLAESMRSPSAFISPEWRRGGPTSGMPLLQLSDAEIAALVDHLLTG